MRAGRTIFGFRPDPRFRNGTGAVHGGILAAVVDFGVMTTLPADSGLVTSNLNVTFVRPVAVGGAEVTCEGLAVHVGRTIAHAEAVIHDPAGEVLVRASATCRVRRPDQN